MRRPTFRVPGSAENDANLSHVDNQWRNYACSPRGQLQPTPDISTSAGRNAAFGLNPHKCDVQALSGFSDRRNRHQLKMQCVGCAPKCAPRRSIKDGFMRTRGAHCDAHPTSLASDTFAFCKRASLQLLVACHRERVDRRGARNHERRSQR